MASGLARRLLQFRYARSIAWTSGEIVLVARARAAEQRVRAYDKDDRVVAIYPATVGSGARPSPEGELKVTAVAENPTYDHDPSLTLRGVDVQEKLELPFGPNNPVGLVCIALSAKGLLHSWHTRT